MTREASGGMTREASGGMTREASGGMMPEALGDGIVYTETVVHTAPQRYVQDAPYQIGIIEIPGRGRVTARIIGKDESGGENYRGRARIGDHVSFTEWREGIPYFSLAEKPPGSAR